MIFEIETDKKNATDIHKNTLRTNNYKLVYAHHKSIPTHIQIHQTILKSMFRPTTSTNKNHH